jgi:spermidine synthase
LKKNINRRITAVVIATGISSVVTQLLVIREFLSQFCGNEFVVALILFNWLLIGGVGTFVAKFAGPKSSLRRLAWVSICLAFLSPLTLICIRLLRDAFFVYGSSVGFYPTFFFSFLSTLPYCLLLGFALPYSLIVAGNVLPGFTGTKIYILDNIGDVLGGILFSFILVIWVSPLQAISIANLLLIAVSCWMAGLSRQSRVPLILGAFATLSVLCAGVLFENKTLDQPGMNLVYYKESRYGRIEVFKNSNQYTLYRDGKPIFSSQNTDLAEETIHYPLSQAKRSDNILLISAEGGVMSEIEKYHPESVDYVEIDSMVADTLFRYELIKKIHGLNTIHLDGRAYLSQSKKKYDAIILSLPEPDTFQINRFYTERFFELAETHLAPGGIFSFSIEGFDNYPTEAQAIKISSLYHTVRKVFNHVMLLPGQKIFFLCSNKPLQTDIPRLLEDKNIQTRYVKGFYYWNMSGERIQYLLSQIRVGIPINSDFSPFLIRLMYTEWFQKYSTSPNGFILVLIIALIIYIFRISKEEFLLFSTGFMLMGSELLVIFVFQICFGYIYQQIGIIVTTFLAGLFPGAILGHYLQKRSRQVLFLTDLCLILLLATLILAMGYAEGYLSQGFFIAFGFALALACGCQFPAVLHLRGSGKEAVIEAFSSDLAGAAFGTLITSTILIPYLGIMGAALGLIFLKATSLMVMRSGHENA